MGNGTIAILGVFVADTAYRANRQPRMGETILGNSFSLGPGGKGSNQAVAAARAGGDVVFISRIGDDDFAEIANKTWAEAGVKPAVTRDPTSYTGAAYIFVEEATGDNAIIVSPGAAMTISVEDIDARADTIANASVFVTQLEQPIAAARHALELARRGGAITILNPAPAAPLDDAIFALCDYVTPNETEAAELTGQAVTTIDDARKAADLLVRKGVGTAVITLGENGVLVHGPGVSEHVPAFHAGAVVETTGAGDAFNGGFAVALAEGRDPVEAARFGCAAAGISVTRPGTAPSMPSREEIDVLLAR
jgi:ribokinase